MLSLFRQIKHRLGGFDFWIIGFAAVLTTIGLFSLQSIQTAQGAVSGNIVERQLLALVIGVGSFLVISSTDYRHLYYFFPLFYVLTIALLAAVILQGETVRGATRWFELAGYQFQPSEIAKLLMVIFFAFYLRWGHQKMSPWLVMLTSLLLMLPVLAFIFIEPDLSTCIIFFILWLGLLWFGSQDLKPLIFLSFVILIILPLAYLALNPYQQSRLVSFIDPYKDPLGSGYHSIQATIAIGSGQLWGRQWGKGTQSHLMFLPDQHTDFIFAVFCEEQGFVGAMFFCTVYGLFLWRLSKAAASTQESAGRMLTGGVLIIFLVQFVINIGMNIGLLPVTGVSLPLASYGGTSLVVNLASLGLTESILRHRP